MSVSLEILETEILETEILEALKTLETKNLIIKAPQLEDFANLYALQTDADVMKYIGHGVRTQAEVMNGLEKAMAHQEKYGFSLGCVFEKESGLFVGRAGLIYLAYDDTQPEIEVGYALMKTAWGKGYGVELAKALIKWGFQHLTVSKLVAVIHPNNEHSRRVLEGAHMNYVGRAHYWGNEVAFYDIPRPQVDYSKIKCIPATLADHPTIQNMARFYVYDMSEYFGNEQGWEIPEDGLYECIDFKKYWEDENAFPFIFRYENEMIGFAIVDKKGSEPSVDFNMAQFFVLRKFKHKGIGRHIAEHCFKKFGGVWEIMVMPGNEGAYRFWRCVIKHYGIKNYGIENHGTRNDSSEQFTEYTREIPHFNYVKKNIFRFNSANLI